VCACVRVREKVGERETLCVCVRGGVCVFVYDVCTRVCVCVLACMCVCVFFLGLYSFTCGVCAYMHVCVCVFMCVQQNVCVTIACVTRRVRIRACVYVRPDVCMRMCA